MYFWHLGILSSDIDRMIDEFCDLPDVTRGAWTIIEVDFPQNKMIVGAGGRIKVAYARIKGCVCELLQPLDGTSYHAGELGKKGSGQHHLAFVCPDGWEDALKSLMDVGGRVVWEFKDSEEHACYVETADGSMIVELINVCPFMPE